MAAPDNQVKRKFHPVPADPVPLGVWCGPTFESLERSATISVIQRQDEVNYQTVTIPHTSGFLLEINVSLKYYRVS
jgi:hypothetical protein